MPESSYHSYIQKTDGAGLDFDNSTLQVGYIYKVKVTEAGFAGILAKKLASKKKPPTKYIVSG